ncbi:MAG: hypothetical protein NVSMB63_18960 [Sediminibacterium sp.]
MPVCVTIIGGLGVNAVLVTLQSVTGLYEIEATGAGVMVILVLVIYPGHGEDAAMVYETL